MLAFTVSCSEEGESPEGGHQGLLYFNWKHHFVFFCSPSSPFYRCVCLSGHLVGLSMVL